MLRVLEDGRLEMIVSFDTEYRDLPIFVERPDEANIIITRGGVISSSVKSGEKFRIYLMKEGEVLNVKFKENPFQNES